MKQQTKHIENQIAELEQQGKHVKNQIVQL